MKYQIRRKEGHWVLRNPQGRVFSTTKHWDDALAFIRAIHGRRA
ncbi:hypothetical protein [Glutamicibacter creatinolyticus]